MRVRRLLLGIGLVAVLAGIVVAVALSVSAIRRHGGVRGALSAAGEEIEAWVGGQIMLIAGSYLEPRLSFEELEYLPPLGVRVRHVRLTAADGTESVFAGELSLSLAKLPQRGKPIVIERVTLKDARLRLIRERGADGETRFRGLVPLVRAGALREPASVEGNARLSNVFRLRRLELVNGSIEFSDAVGGAAPMVISGVTLALDAEPDEAGAEPGWHRVTIESGREPLARVTFDGRVNLDSLDVEARSASVVIDLDASGRAGLPGELRSLLAEHDVRGRVELRGSGLVAMRDASRTRLVGELHGNGINAAAGEYRLPIDSLGARFEVSGAAFSCERAEAALLGGTLRFEGVHGNFGAGDRPMGFTWRANGLDLREMLRTKTTPGAPPRLAGMLDSSGAATVLLARPTDSLGGSGSLRVRDGRLINIPLVHDLTEAAASIAEAVGAGSVRDSADVGFRFDSGVVRVESMNLETQAVVARGSGSITFGGVCDLMMNAGPMEKVQGLLGEIGAAIGKVTDRLVKYHVTGPIGDPSVKVRPLGL